MCDLLLKVGIFVLYMLRELKSITMNDWRHSLFIVKYVEPVDFQIEF